MKNLNGPPRRRRPKATLTDKAPLVLVAGLVATFFVATYLVPRLWPSNVQETSAQQSLSEAATAAQSGDQKRAREILLGLANKNNAQAQLRLAEMYEVGPPDGNADLNQAASWYAKAAAAGLVNAKARLGHLYLEGIGVVQDFAKAKPLLEAAANDGNKIAQFDLGRMRQHGWGGAKNERLAYAWFELAAQQNYAPAIKARDELLNGLSPEQVKEAQDLLEKLKSNILKPSGQG